MQGLVIIFAKKCHDHVPLRLAKKLKPIRTGAHSTAAAVPAVPADGFRAMAKEEEEKKKGENKDRLCLKTCCKDMNAEK